MSKVKHIAFVKFKPGTSSEQIDQIFSEILDLTETIPGIEDYVSGENNSPEGQSNGFTHGFVMTFHDTAARDAYLANDIHKKFLESATPHLEAVQVVDFEV
jgi:hypothetical protein